jgi:hypothetical protein
LEKEQIASNFKGHRRSSLSRRQLFEAETEIIKGGSATKKNGARGAFIFQ